MEFMHVPVLLEEAVKFLAVRPDGVYVDCTAGGGGHSREIVRRLDSGGTLLAIDQDEEALAAASQILAPWSKQVILQKANFRHLDRVLTVNGIKHVDGILMDVGVSSFQIENVARGFAYRNEAPLDMRMDKEGEVKAADLVNHAPRDELIRIIAGYGEERWARRIVDFIIRARDKHLIATTRQLVEIIECAIPARARKAGSHPAKRTFQALRIAINDELGALQEALEKAVVALAPGGRLVVITFHSLEDRLVKKFFRQQERPCVCPPDLPVCACERRPQVKVLTSRPVVPDRNEMVSNPRSHSAKLRAFEKI